ncbi:conserved hypothetical protein [Ricinus communis]|uniref:Uncharacterized protein n=1 Tax=Ricinus communis TaxID=3988 RepID=B9TGY1_RICCO|nr:conserved hypothetical protein [Ricinus communis]
MQAGRDTPSATAFSTGSIAPSSVPISRISFPATAPSRAASSKVFRPFRAALKSRPRCRCMPPG